MDDTGPGGGHPSYWEEPKPGGGCLKAIAILLVAFGLILVVLLLLPAILMNMDPAFHEVMPDATSSWR
jgi:hypothetical protein